MVAEGRSATAAAAEAFPHLKAPHDKGHRLLMDSEVKATIEELKEKYAASDYDSARRALVRALEDPNTPATALDKLALALAKITQRMAEPERTESKSVRATFAPPIPADLRIERQPAPPALDAPIQSISTDKGVGGIGGEDRVPPATSTIEEKKHDGTQAHEQTLAEAELEYSENE